MNRNYWPLLCLLALVPGLARADGMMLRPRLRVEGAAGADV